MSEQQYSTLAYEWVAREKNAINQVAEILGVSAVAIAGFMAKERTDYDAVFGLKTIRNVPESKGSASFDFLST
jgi:hypothetical protein